MHVRTAPGRPRGARTPPAPRISPLATTALIGATLVYCVALHSAYRDLISPVFSYLGLTYRVPDTLSEMASIALTVALVLVMPRVVRRPSDFILWVLLLVAVAPSILIAQYADILPVDRSLDLALLMFAVQCAVIACARVVSPSFRLTLTVPVPALVTGIVIVSVGINGFLVLRAGSSFQLVTFDAVQDLRESYKTAVAGIPFMGYVLQLQTAAVNPVLMAWGVTTRRWWVVAAGVGSQVLIYGITGYKLTILSPVFVVLLALYLRGRPGVRGLHLVTAMAVTTTGAVALDSAMGGRFFVGVFVNRLIATPGVLTTAYFRVFDEQPRYHWAHSFMSPFLDPPFDLNPAYLVGRAYQGVDTQANVNFIGDGYANWGVLGILLEAGFLLVVLAVVDAATDGIPLSVSAPATMVAALGLANNSAFTSVLTGGFAGLVLLFAMWPRSPEETEDDPPSRSHGAAVCRPRPGRGTRAAPQARG